MYCNPSKKSDAVLMKFIAFLIKILHNNVGKGNWRENII